MLNSPAPSRPAGHRLLDFAGLFAGTMATALVAGLVALVGIIAARAVLHVEIIGPRGGRAFDAAAPDQLTFLAAFGSFSAATLVQALVYVTPRPLLFFGLISWLITAAVSLWPLTTEAGAVSKVASTMVYLGIGTAISTLTATVARHAGT